MELASRLKSKKNTYSNNNFLGQNKSTLFSLFIILVSALIRIFCIGSHNLFVEEAYYWNYSQNLDFGYLDHPPAVALLIKTSTLIFGTNELSVRIPALFCWGLTAFFSFKLSELIYRGSGIHAVLLLSVMPFYFFQSTLITPDQPVMACWSALLYYFYRIFLLDESKSWYKAGVWLGLGMLSKYTVVLFGPTVLLYLITVPSARPWFTRKEPYICTIIALCIFTPVIYWNAMHEWISFVFQSTRRFKSTYKFTFHYFLALVMLFLLPAGFIGLAYLFDKKYVTIDEKTRWFLQLFTLFPLLFFGAYSLSHAIKMDWIGPGLISIIPWLALLISKKDNFYKSWHLGSLFLLPCYLVLISLIAFGSSEKASQLFLRKHISWENMTQQLHDVAKNESQARKTIPIFVPLDVYNIGSELVFYQAKLFEQGTIEETYPVIGRHIFGEDSLMYQYWSNGINISDKTLILVTTNIKDFNLPSIKNQTLELTPPKKVWSHSQGSGKRIEPYYYKIVHMKDLSIHPICRYPSSLFTKTDTFMSRERLLNNKSEI